MAFRAKLSGLMNETFLNPQGSELEGLPEGLTEVHFEVAKRDGRGLPN